MAKHAKTTALLVQALEILTNDRPMTVRQVYYQLVSRQVIANSLSQYKAVSKALVEARKDGAIPWDWIEDRLRRPREVSMWDDLGDFVDTAMRSYRLNVWDTQPHYIECWLEKDALSGIFEGVLNGYGITLNVGRGYDGWDSIRNAAARFGTGENATILYYGDFDPSGDDMIRSLRERLTFFNCRPEVIKCAITRADISTYNLPPNRTKKTDTRSAAFVKKWGDLSVELDALPTAVLRSSLENEIGSRFDMPALAAVREKQAEDKQRLYVALADLGD